MYYLGLKKEFAQDIQLLYTDTDSFIISLRRKEWLASLKNLEEWFDFSNLPINHPLYSTKNKNVLGKFKLETRAALILAGIFLRAKCYSLLLSSQNLDKTEARKYDSENQTENLRISKSKGKRLLLFYYIFFGCPAALYTLIYSGVKRASVAQSMDFVLYLNTMFREQKTAISFHTLRSQRQEVKYRLILK